MASILNLRQRALLVVIRAPTLFSSSLRSSAQIRCIHDQESQSNDDFSISFGPRVDDLLKTSRRRKGRPSLGSTKVSKKANNPIKNLDKLVVEQSLLPNNINESGSHNVTEVKTHSSEDLADASVTKPSQNYSRHQDEMTIELSGDAYETISTAEISHAAKTTRIEGSRKRVSYSEPALKAQTTDSSASQSTQDSTSVWKPPKREQWQIQKDALRQKFGETGWNPRKKLSPDALDGIRGLHEQEPERYTTEILSRQFKVSPEAIRRILKAKWRPTPEKMDERRERWARRHDRIWDQKAELGLRPARFRDRAPEGPEAFEEEVRAKQLLGHM